MTSSTVKGKGRVAALPFFVMKLIDKGCLKLILVFKDEKWCKKMKNNKKCCKF